MCRGGSVMHSNPIYEVMEQVVSALVEIGIEYAITGSVASGLYGEPISTQDVDIIVRMTEQQANRLGDMLPPGLYRNKDSLVAAARNGGIVNVIDMDSAFKVDLSVVQLTPFHLGVFKRCRGIELEPGCMRIEVVSPEDIILMKLDWRKDTRSTKQWDNALSVSQVQGARMDWGYMFKQAETLGIVDDLTKLRDEAGI